MKLRWDPYPFILLNLAFSTQAAYAAPLILLAQNRQENRDRVALEEDRRRAEQTKADTEYLARELAACAWRSARWPPRLPAPRTRRAARNLDRLQPPNRPAARDGAGKAHGASGGPKSSVDPGQAIAATRVTASRYGDLVHNVTAHLGRLSAHRGRSRPRGSAAPSRASDAHARVRRRGHRPLVLAGAVGASSPSPSAQVRDRRGHTAGRRRTATGSALRAPPWWR